MTTPSASRDLQQQGLFTGSWKQAGKLRAPDRPEAKALQLQPEPEDHVPLHVDHGVSANLLFITERDGKGIAEAVTSYDLYEVGVLFRQVKGKTSSGEISAGVDREDPRVIRANKPFPPFPAQAHVGEDAVGFGEKIEDILPLVSPGEVKRQFISKVQLPVHGQAEILVDIKVCHLISSIQSEAFGPLVFEASHEALPVCGEPSPNGFSHAVDQAEFDMEITGGGIGANFGVAKASAKNSCEKERRERFHESRVVNKITQDVKAKSPRHSFSRPQETREKPS